MNLFEWIKTSRSLLQTLTLQWKQKEKHSRSLLKIMEKQFVHKKNIRSLASYFQKQNPKTNKSILCRLTSVLLVLR